MCVHMYNISGSGFYQEDLEIPLLLPLAPPKWLGGNRRACDTTTMAAPAPMAAEEEEWIEMQRVEVFERSVPVDSVLEEIWKPTGVGTVMWQQEGSIQRLLVVSEEGSEYLKEQACVVLPDPSLEIYVLPSERIIYWRSPALDREVALSFTSTEGCAQVWEDIQLLQTSTGSFDALDALDEGGMMDLTNLDSLLGISTIVPLPPPSLETLPQILDMLSSGYGRDQMIRSLELDQPPDGRGDDYIAKLCDLFEAVDRNAQRWRQAQAIAEPQTVVRATPSIATEWGNGEAEAEEAGEGAPAKECAEPCVAPAELEPLRHLAAAFRCLLALGAGDPRLLQRLLRRDTVAFMFGALEYEPPRGDLQTASVNTSHREFVLSARRFKMPVPILDPVTLECIHQNFLISYLSETILPLAIDPAALAALTEMQQARPRRHAPTANARPHVPPTARSIPPTPAHRHRHHLDPTVTSTSLRPTAGRS